MARLFGTDGVRGVANSELSALLALKLGSASAYVLRKKHDGAKMLIGRDPRISGDILESAMASGICSLGVDVYLTDVVPTGYQAAEMGGIREGDTVVVFGAGPVGIMAARCSWLFGAGRVIIIDHLEYRLEFAKQYAQCEAYNFKSMDDPVLFLKKTTDWFGADVCIDAVGGDASGSALQTFLGKKLKFQGGSALALQWAINSVKKGGIVSIVGVYGPTDNLLPIGNVVNKGLTIRANQASVKRLLPRLIEHVKEGRINPKGIITHRLPLREVADAYHMFSAKLDNIVKPVLVP
jgi:threonine dehydrogenase-like Zn-dependent dehydrogenase